MQNTTPKHYVLNVKQHPGRTITSIQLALQRPPKIYRPRRKNKNREDQRFGDPPMNKSKHLCFILWQGVVSHKCQTRLYLKIICNQLKSNLIWTYVHFLVNFLGGFPKYHHFTKRVKYVSTHSVVIFCWTVEHHWLSELQGKCIYSRDVNPDIFGHLNQRVRKNTRVSKFQETISYIRGSCNVYITSPKNALL